MGKDNDAKRRELLSKSFERWKATGEQLQIETRAKIFPSPIQRYFTQEGEPKVIFHDNGAISVGLSRFYTPGTEAEFEKFKVKYGELPAEARKAIQNELRRREIFLRSAAGRPRGSGYFENEQQFRNEIGGVVKDLNERGEEITQKKVAEIYNCDVRQLRGWCRENTGLTWREFVNEMLAI